MQAIVGMGIAALVSTLTLDSTAQTTWTGASSTSWTDPANWTAGVPNATTDAVIAATMRQPDVVGTVSCRDLTVVAGTSMTTNAGAVLEVWRDATIAASVQGQGGVILFTADLNNPPPPHQVVFSNGASVPELTVDQGRDATFTDLNVRGRFSTESDSLGLFNPTINWNGATVLGSADVLIGSGSQGTIVCQPTGSLDVVGTFSLEWNFEAPGDMAVGRLQMNPTSSVRPGTGVTVIRVRPGRRLQIDHQAFNGTSLPMIDVPSSSQFEFIDSFDDGISHRIEGITGPGTVLVDSEEDTVIAGLSVGGAMTLRGDQLTLDARVPAPGTPSPFVVQVGGALVLESGNSAPDLTVIGDLQVDGNVTIKADSVVSFREAVPGTAPMVTVGPTGSLRIGEATGTPPILQGFGSDRFGIDLHGQLAGRNFEIHDLVAAGARLLAGSTIGTAPDDLRGAVFDDGEPVPGSVLLELGRSGPTVLDGVRLDATNSAASHGIRATTAQSVQVLNPFGALGSELFEDDPDAVISWTPGVTFFGTATPGCAGLAEMRTASAPRIGNGTFAFELAGGPPGEFAFQALGLGGLAAPLQIVGVDFWVDLGQFVSTAFLPLDGTGGYSWSLPVPNLPNFVGIEIFGQALIVEPMVCPMTFSGSTAIRVEVLP